MKVSKQVIDSYNASRLNTNKALICHAPFTNLNFEQNGNVRACCYNTKHILGTWPHNRIKEIWQGTQANILRQYIRESNLGGGCVECGNMLVAGNYQGVRARYYDDFDKGNLSAKVSSLIAKVTGAQAYPRVMEFELSNQCNLECVMCNGYFSSSIRKNREHLPAINSVYNDAFVDELDEFIPYLTDAKFLGGEPFMIDIYLKIWERILKIKPGIRIHITTNGTFLNSRVKDLLEGLNAGIIMSVDSVNPETYKRIRVNGSMDKVMENLEYFQSYTARKKTFLSMAACPITYNWRELPSLLEFCINKNIVLYFNAVFSPAELSLREQSAEYLTEVIETLLSYTLPDKQGNDASPRNLSITAFADFVNQLKGWQKEKQAAKATVSVNTVSQLETIFIKEEIEHWTLEEIQEKLQQFTNANSMGYINKETTLLNRITNLFLATPRGKLAAVINCYFEVYALTTDIDKKLAREKAQNIADMIESHAAREVILHQMSTASPTKLAETFYAMETAQLEQLLYANFPQ